MVIYLFIKSVIDVLIKEIPTAFNHLCGKIFGSKLQKTMHILTIALAAEKRLKSSSRYQQGKISQITI